jgi:hypothetical protein
MFIDAHYIKPAPAFKEERAHALPQEVDVFIVAAIVFERLTIAINTLELAQAGDHVRRDIDRAIAAGSDKARGRGAHSLNGLGPVRNFLDVDTRGQVFRH